MNANPYQTQPMPQAQPPRRTPRWARKRIVLPALAVTGLIGIGIGSAGATGETSPSDGAPESRATTTATATVTATASAAPEAKPEALPAPTVTKTVKVPVRTTVTATAEAPADDPAADSGTGSDEGTSVSYGNCSEARAAGAAPVHRGDPGYGRHLDRDGDGVGCDM